MNDFNVILMRHGEHVVQAILEDWETHNGIIRLNPVSLRARWAAFIALTDDQLTKRVA